MKKKVAVLQVADTGPLESLVVMLESVGYDCYLPDAHVRAAMRGEAGCDSVLEIKHLVENMGYENPMTLKKATLQTFVNADLIVDIKAHRNHSKYVKQWPQFEGKVLWYRINGCEPEITKQGDERNLPCPILTPNMRYGDDGPWKRTGSYACWPPFRKFHSYCQPRVREYEAPISLIHNLQEWGYQEMIAPCNLLGIRLFGARSPHGLVPHQEVPNLLSAALCMIHLKSSDSPGYALYEACAAACPLIVPRRLIWRSKMQDLFEEGVTCLCFDQETHDPLSYDDMVECTREINEGMLQLKDAAENERIGRAAQTRLREIMWSAQNDLDVNSLKEFFHANF